MTSFQTFVAFEALESTLNSKLKVFQRFSFDVVSENALSFKVESRNI